MSINYNEWIDKKVIKKSGKPFKSKNKVNTVKSIISHLFLPELAFTFYEDDSYVSCSQCNLNTENETAN